MKSVLTMACAVLASGLSFGQTSFNFIPNGTGKDGSIQYWVVPNCVNKIKVEAAGAKGGSNNGGGGAIISGDFNVTGGDTLYIVVGQMGTTNSCGTSQGSGGGGGGSFVWKYNSPSARTLLMAAGGGGGGNSTWGPTCSNGLGGDTATAGLQGNNATSAPGGVNGMGGSGVAASGVGAGGAGWLGNGINSTYSIPSYGGESWPSFKGGKGSSSFTSGANTGDGGYGGGGGAVCGSGGGGGYSGGGGGEGSICRTGGGGGGSFNAGSNKFGQPGANFDHGYVNITILEVNSFTSSISPNLDSVCVNTEITFTVNMTPGINDVFWSGGVQNGIPYPIQNSGTYTGIVSYNSGCYDTVSYTVNVFPYQIPTINYTPTVDPPSILQVSPSYETYNWNNGSNTQTIIVNLAGTYFVEVVDSFDCHFVSDDVNVFFTTGINEYENGKILLYPNPVSEFLTIKLVDVDFTEAEFKIMDMSGKTLISINEKLGNGNISINISELKAGNYLLNINNKLSIPFVKK